MGIFDRILGKGRERPARPSRRPRIEEPPEETLSADDMMVDHEFVFFPEDDYERNIRSMGYRIRIENKSDYPMGAPRIQFVKRSKLGKFGEPESPKGMIDPGKDIEYMVPFSPLYAGGKEDIEFKVHFFDFRAKTEQTVQMRTEPLKVVVPKFKPLKKDDEGYRVLVSNLYRWTVETKVMNLPPKELFESVSASLSDLGFSEANSVVNENLFRGIRQFCAADDKGRKWAVQVQIIGKGRESKLLLYTYGERPLYAYNLATRAILKIPQRDRIISSLMKDEEG
jgi:hypothetical protein